MSSWAEKQAARELKYALLDIASDLDDLHTGVSAVKVLGKAGAIIGAGVAAGIATVLTGGLAAPLAAGGVAAAIGTATAVGADIVESVVSRSKLKKAQSELDEFRSICLKIRDFHKTAEGVAKGASALKNVIKNPQAVQFLGGVEKVSSGIAKGVGKALPVIDVIFVALDVIDILEIIVSDGKSAAADNLRALVRNTLDCIIDN